MNDLERLHEISNHAARRLQDILTRVLDEKDVSLRCLKTVALCCNELLSRIPDSDELKELTSSTLYNVLLDASLNDALERLDAVIIQLREEEQRMGDDGLFEHLFPDYDSDSFHYEY